MRTAVALAVVLATSSPNVALAGQGGEAAFGNTTVSAYPDGRTAQLWLQPDGSYQGRGRRGKPSSGRWRVKGAEMCFRQSRPFPAPFSYCAPLVQGGVGTVWAGKAVTGEPIRLELVGGREGTPRPAVN